MKRRTGNVLPVTSSDAVNGRKSRKSSRKGSKRRRKRSALCGPVFWRLLLLGTIIVLTYFVFKRGGSGKSSLYSATDLKDMMKSELGKKKSRGRRRHESRRHVPPGHREKRAHLDEAGGGLSASPDRPRTDRMINPMMKELGQLSKFSSLQHSLRNAELVAMYFAASWCPESTPITEKLTGAFQSTDVLLDPASEKGMGGANMEMEGQQAKYPLAIVFVSSDNSEKQMMEYGSKLWHRVPFNTEERTLLKQHFHTCALREADDLKVDRRNPIPTLIIIDSDTQGILTTDGVSDVREHGSAALEHWQELQQLVRGLEDKFVAEE